MKANQKKKAKPTGKKTGAAKKDAAPAKGKTTGGGKKVAPTGRPPHPAKRKALPVKGKAGSAGKTARAGTKTPAEKNAASVVPMPHYADIEAISKHIEKKIGPIKTVFHEIVSDDLHIDIHLVEATRKRPFHVLVTTGMSALPMNVPPGVSPYAEVMAFLPKEWNLTREGLMDERNYWPIRLLKSIARLPHASRSWVGVGHTISDAEPGKLKDYARNTKLCSAILLPPITLDESAWAMKRKGKEPVNFHAIVPIHREELRHTMKHGANALLGLFNKAQVGPVIDPARGSVV